MNKFTRIAAGIALTLVSASYTQDASATTYTAVVSGNFSAAATWGGIAPGTLLSTDAVIIPVGITVTLNTTQTFSSGTSLTVNGTLTSASSAGVLILASGNLGGSGTISTDSLALSSTSGFTYTGSIATLKMSCTGGSIASSAAINVNAILHLTGGNMNMAAGSLTMGSTATIEVAGGTLSTSGTGALNLSNYYRVRYIGSGVTAGAELSGSGLADLSINTPSNNVTLSSNITVNGMLTLTAGTLVLNGKNLTFGMGGNLSASGSGIISSTSASSIAVNSVGGLTGALNFASSGNTVNNFTVNDISGMGSVTLASDLNVNGTLALTNGTLNLNGKSLAIGTAGDITGSGTISSTSTSNIIINSTSSITGNLKFTPSANTINNLTLNFGSSTGYANLGSDVTVNGTLALTSGILKLNSRNLTLGTSGNLTGSGQIYSTSFSSIFINAINSLSAPLTFATLGNTVNNIWTSPGGVTLGSDLIVEGILGLGGVMKLNGKNLTVNVDGTLNGTGSISSTAASNIVINAYSSLSGPLTFTPTANNVNNFTINPGGNNVILGSDVVVNGMLTLASGGFGLNGHGLTIATTGDLTGTGNISSTSSSNLTINATSGLTGILHFSPPGYKFHNFTVNTGSSGNVTLGSDLEVDGTLALTNGLLVLNGNNLVIGLTGDIAAVGSGSIYSSSGSNITVNATNSLTGKMNFEAGSNTVGTFTVNMGNATSNLNLGTDLNISNELKLQYGRLNIGKSNLVIAAAGKITGGSPDAYIGTGSTGNVSATLNASFSDTFQIGTATHYAPIAVTANSGSANGVVNVRAIDTVYAHGTYGTDFSMTQPVVKSTWMVGSTATNINYDLTAMWTANMEVNGFNRNQAYISHYTNNAWDVQTASSAAASANVYSITRAGITSLSPFTVADKKADLSTTGITTINGNGDVVNIYPNPATDNIVVNTKLKLNKADIYSVNGTLVKSATITSNTVSVNDLPAGFYTIQLTGDNVNFITKFVKQ